MLRRVLPVIIALMLGAAAVASSAGGPQVLSSASQDLPDLDQEAPWNLKVTRTRLAAATGSASARPSVISAQVH